MKKLLIAFTLLTILIIAGCSSPDKVNKADKTKVEATTNQSETSSFFDEYSEVLKTTWKDASFDTENNLQKPFYIKGTANLSNYYNYKFTNKQKLFSVEVIPEDGNFSDRWFIYLDREEFKGVYDELKVEQDKPVEVIAYIPTNSYSNGQDNMALGMTVNH